MTDRRTFLVGVGTLVSLPIAAEAQRPRKVYRLGFLANVPPTTPDVARNHAGLFQGLRELGYVEGQNLVSSGDMRRAGRIDGRDSPASWLHSRSTSS